MGYSSTGHTTKAYKLRPEVRERARSALRNYDGQEWVIDDKGKQIFKHHWPERGNQCKESKIKVPGLIPVDLGPLDETIETMMEVEQEQPRSGNFAPAVSEDIDQLCDMRRCARATGGMPNFYKEERSGRLGFSDVVGPKHSSRLPGYIGLTVIVAGVHDGVATTVRAHGRFDPKA